MSRFDKKTPPKTSFLFPPVVIYLRAILNQRLELIKLSSLFPNKKKEEEREEQGALVCLLVLLEHFSVLQSTPPFMFRDRSLLVSFKLPFQSTCGILCRPGVTAADSYLFSE